MKSLIITLLLMAFAPASIGQDATLEISPFAASENDFHGAMLGTTIGSNWIFQGSVVLSDNLSGASLGIGKRFGNLSIIAGALFDPTIDKRNGFVDVAGVDIFDESATPDIDTAPFIEAEYKGFFLRYTEYQGDYVLRADRIITHPGPTAVVSAAETIDIDESVIYAGYRIRF